MLTVTVVVLKRYWRCDFADLFDFALELLANHAQMVQNLLLIVAYDIDFYVHVSIVDLSVGTVPGVSPSGDIAFAGPSHPSAADVGRGWNW